MKKYFIILITFLITAPLLSLYMCAPPAPQPITAALAAFAGVFIGSRFIQKTTERFIQITVGIMMIFIAVGLIAGII